MLTSTTHQHKNVMVFGAGGRIGLPLSVFLACEFVNQVNKVYGIELDQSYCDNLNTGEFVPFMEDKLEEYLKRAIIDLNTLHFTTDFEKFIDDCDEFIIMVGTPKSKSDDKLDSSSIFKIIDALSKHNLNEKTVVIRSTVEPGTTDLIFDTWPGEKPFIYYEPERVIEGKALTEFKHLPSMVGIPANATYRHNNKIDISDFETILMTAKEAEFAKIATNMIRYVDLAFTNELMLRADEIGIDFNSIVTKMKRQYPRLDNLKFPGPNVGGPCLFKDGLGWSQSKIKNSLVKAAFEINSNKVVGWVAGQITGKPEIRKVMILGTAFKPESDDDRHSMALELINMLEISGLVVNSYDPYIDKDRIITNKEIYESDAFILMTPHEKFETNGFFLRIRNHGADDAWFFNYWSAFCNTRHKNSDRLREPFYKYSVQQLRDVR